VSSGIVVGSILLAGDQLLRVEELAVGSGPHFIDHSGLKIHENSPRKTFRPTLVNLPLIYNILPYPNGSVSNTPKRCSAEFSTMLPWIIQYRPVL